MKIETALDTKQEQSMSIIARHLDGAFGNMAPPQAQRLLIEFPDDPVAAAQGLQELTRLKFEFMITYDADLDTFILSTGTKSQSWRQEDTEVQERLMRGSASIHNHEEIDGVDKFTPSRADMRLLAD